MLALSNFMERLVREKVDSIIKSVGMCGCEQCRLDVMALALNALPPKYVVTEKGEIYTRLDGMREQIAADVVRELTKAAEVVSGNPRHEA